MTTLQSMGTDNTVPYLGNILSEFAREVVT